MACGITNRANYVERCGNTGDVSGSTASGITWHAIKIENCYNTGKITGNGNVATAFGITNSTRWQTEGCFTYNTSTQVPLAGKTTGGTYGDQNEVTNSYYLASSATAVSSAGEWASADDFASGR